MFHCSEGGKGHSSVDARVGGRSAILTSNLSGLTIESTMQSGSLSDFLRMAGIFGPDRKRKGFIVPYKVKLRASSSLHHWGRGTASAVEGVRLIHPVDCRSNRRIWCGEHRRGLLRKESNIRAPQAPSGEDETKMGSIFVPHFHPPMVGMEVL